jgi:Acetyltransferase (GNAT) domain
MGSDARADQDQPDLCCGTIPADQQDDWDDWAIGSPFGHMHQLFWWANPLRAYGMRSEVVAGWSGADLEGGTLFRCSKVPGLPVQIAESIDGPLFARWQSGFAVPYARAIARLGRDARALAIVIRGCPDPLMHRDLVAALRLEMGDVVLSRGATEAVLGLADHSVESLWGGFSHGVRNSVKRGRSRGVRVVQLEDDQALKAAHDCWMATAQRKGFESVRPWPALQPVLRQAISSGSGVVFGAMLGEQIIAAIFVTYIGRSAAYVYGGHLDGAEQHSPAHVLQVAAIDEAVRRGFEGYSFGILPAADDDARTGVRYFKLSFGTEPRQMLETITWRRHIFVYEGLTRLRSHPIGVRIERALRRRRVGGGRLH